VKGTRIPPDEVTALSTQIRPTDCSFLLADSRSGTARTAVFFSSALWTWILNGFLQRVELLIEEPAAVSVLGELQLGRPGRGGSLSKDGQMRPAK